MIIKSIRWRLQLWLAFLLVCVLTGFGATVYQLQRINQLRQIDEELEHRVAVVSRAVRGGPPPGFAPGHPPFEGRPSGPDFDDDPQRQPPPRGRSDLPRLDSGRGMRRDIRLSSEVTNLFDEAGTNTFYFSV